MRLEPRNRRRVRVAGLRRNAIAVADRLAIAAQALLDEETRVARKSFGIPDGRGRYDLDEATWADLDPEGFPLVKALREELAAYAIARKPS